MENLTVKQVVILHCTVSFSMKTGFGAQTTTIIRDEAKKELVPS